MSHTDIQKYLFDQVKVQLNGDASLVDEVADLLSISTDSAYRRLRSETSLTLLETSKIAHKYNISLDGLINADTDSVQFIYNRKKPTEFDYTDYLRSMIDNLDVIACSKNCEALFFAKDFPLFYNFLIPEIGEFKGFFWKRSALQLPEYRGKKFDIGELNDKNVALGFDVIKTYYRIPSTEVWNNEVFNSFLNQIEYCFEAGFFARPSHAFKLLDHAENLLDHFAMQAEYGCKYLMDREPGNNANFSLYYNEVMMGDNTLQLKHDDIITTVFTHNIIHNLVTTDKAFSEKTWEVNTNIISRSTLISSSSEKERNKFFTRLRQNIDKTRYRMGG